MISALELFSGIGAFAEACAKRNIEVVGAFDQDPRANQTYFLNQGLKPIPRNLDSISAAELPPAEIWWMSPPCQPYSVRGNQKGLNDPRSRSLVNLLGLLKKHRPKVLMMENVAAFRDSDAHRLALDTFNDIGYESQVLELSPTDFGVRMRRPRLFIVATAYGVSFKAPGIPQASPKCLKEFIHEQFAEDLIVSQKDFDRYAQSLHIINAQQDDAYAICFTSGYWKSYRSSGSFIETANGRIRRFSPEEIAALMGFSAGFSFPPELTTSAKLKLAGNTVDVRAIDYLLSGISIL